MFGMGKEVRREWQEGLEYGNEGQGQLLCGLDRARSLFVG
jgi:hypothetical protein